MESFWFGHIASALKIWSRLGVQEMASSDSENVYETLVRLRKFFFFFFFIGATNLKRDAVANFWWFPVRAAEETRNDVESRMASERNEEMRGGRGLLQLAGKANYSHSNDSISISGRAQGQKKGEMPVSLLLSLLLCYTYSALATAPVVFLCVCSLPHSLGLTLSLLCLSLSSAYVSFIFLFRSLSSSLFLLLTLCDSQLRVSASSWKLGG